MSGQLLVGVLGVLVAAMSIGFALLQTWYRNKEQQLHSKDLERAVQRALQEASERADREIERIRLEMAKREVDLQSALQHRMSESLQRLQMNVGHTALPTIPGPDLKARLGMRSAQTITQVVEQRLDLLRNALEAEAASVLVPDPTPGSQMLVFLSVLGPAAERIRKTKVPPESVAHRVFRSGKPLTLRDARHDARHLPMVDAKGQYTTRSLLCLPLRHRGQVIGVVQFLNKRSASFTTDDERMAAENLQLLTEHTAEFVRDPVNFDVLSIYAQPERAAATLLFCDLTRSSRLFTELNAGTAINCIDEYLISQTTLSSATTAHSTSILATARCSASAMRC